MTRAPAHLQLMKQVDASDAVDADASEPTLTSVEGAGPDDGRLAHRATHRRTGGVPSRLEAEARLVGFVADLLDAPADATGRVVAGVGAAAIAVMRGARAARPLLRHGSVVLPRSAHPAYFAAAETVGLTPVVVPVDADGRAPLGAITSAIREDTVLVVASAPSYTHGTVDPVGWIAAATGAKDVPLHVDATSGGWAMAYAERAGRVGAPWGFAVPGVTSVAIDVGPESGDHADLSVVLHRDASGARAQDAATFVRGPLDLPSAWTRPSALLADVVETLQEIGHEGSAALAADALEATTALVEGLAEQGGVQVVARPEATVLSLRADTTCDVFTLADALHARGWTTHAVLPEVGAPLLRLPVTAAMLATVDALLDAIAEAVFEAQDRGRAQIDPTLDRMLETVDPEDVRDRSAQLLLEGAASLDAAEPGRPERRSATHLLVTAAQPGVREVLLSLHQDRLLLPVREGQPATTDSTVASE